VEPAEAKDADSISTVSSWGSVEEADILPSWRTHSIVTGFAVMLNCQRRDVPDGTADEVFSRI
jgi:hypothetical protein